LDSLHSSTGNRKKEEEERINLVYRGHLITSLQKFCWEKLQEKCVTGGVLGLSYMRCWFRSRHLMLPIDFRCMRILRTLRLSGLPLEKRKGKCLLRHRIL